MSMTQRENHLLAQIRGPPRQNGTGRVTLKRKLFTWLWTKVKNLLYQQYGLHVNFLNICFSIRNKDRLWHFFSSFKVFDTCSDLEIWLHMTWECHHVISINHQTAWHSAFLCILTSTAFRKLDHPAAYLISLLSLIYACQFIMNESPHYAVN